MSGKRTGALILAAALSVNFMISSPEASEITPSTGAVMSAYQKAYAMNFEIWQPSGLPAGWYATFDGFPVAQIAPNIWVYGQTGLDGAMRPIDILVGSVIPSSVPGLARVASVWTYGKAVTSPEFQKIQTYRINRMGWLNDEGVNTIIAWHTNKPGVYVWLGNNWKFLMPNPGEYTWQMLKRLSQWIAIQLRKNNAWYQGGEPIEAADLARQWGYIWNGRVILQTLKTFRDSGGNEKVTSFRETSTSTSSSGTSTTPRETTKREVTRWDVD